MATAEGLVNEGKCDEATAIGDQMAGINSSIAALEKLMDESRKNAEPVGGAYDGVLHSGAGGSDPKAGKDDFKPFASLGEQLKAIYSFRKKHTVDKRLQQVNNAVLGATEGSGADGGFALQTDFAGMILASAVQLSPLLNSLDRSTR